MFGFKLVKQSKHLEEEQMLSSFRNIVQSLDKECGEFACFVGGIQDQFFHNHVRAHMLIQVINMHVATLESYITLYMQHAYAAPIYELNFSKTIDSIKDTSFKLKQLLFVIENTIGQTDDAKMKIMHYRENDFDEDTIEQMEDELKDKLDDFLLCASNDVMRMTDHLISLIYNVHCGIIHDVIRDCMGVDIVREYHIKQKTKVNNPIVKSYRIDIISNISSKNQNKKGTDTNESIK